VAKGAAVRAHYLAETPQHRTLIATARRAGAARPGGAGPGSGSRAACPARAGQVTPVTPRAVGILIEDSFDPSGNRSYVEHVIPAGTPLPAERVEERFATIIDNQDSVRIQVYEQAGPVASPEAEHNRRVLDGELTGLGALPAGSVIPVTVRIAVDGRLTVVAREPRSARELRLEAYVEGVVDSEETERLTRLVGLTRVRG